MIVVARQRAAFDGWLDHELSTYAARRRRIIGATLIACGVVLMSSRLHLFYSHTLLQHFDLRP